MRAFWKNLMGVLMLVGIAYFLIFGFSMYFWSSLPAAPQPDQGRVYPLNNHGAYTYMNSRESLLHEASFWVCLVCSTGAGLIDHFVDPFDRKSRRRPPWLN
jgi:hypothetical protein